MKKIIIMCLSLIFLGCSHSSSGNSNNGTSANANNSNPQINGVDYSGTYNANNIACYNSTLTSMIDASNFSGVYQDTITISGNNFSSTETSSNCTVTTSGQIEFFQDGTMNISNEIVDSATNGSCTITSTLSNSNISPSTVSATYYAGENVGAKNGIAYLADTQDNVFGFSTIFTDNKGGYCFEILSRQ